MANDGRKFYAQTNKDADRNRIITFTLPDGSSTQDHKVALEEFIPEDPNGAILESFQAVNNTHFLVHYSKNVRPLYAQMNNIHISRFI